MCSMASSRRQLEWLEREKKWGEVWVWCSGARKKNITAYQTLKKREGLQISHLFVFGFSLVFNGGAHLKTSRSFI